MTNESEKGAAAPTLEERVAALEGEHRAAEVAAEGEPDWNDFEEEEPDDRDDLRVLKRMWDALPEGHCLFWAYDDDDELLTRTVVGDDDDDDQDDDDDAE